MMNILVPLFCYIFAVGMADDFDSETSSWEGSTAPLFYSNATTLATTSMRYDVSGYDNNVILVINSTFQLQNGQVWKTDGTYAAVYGCIQAYSDQ